MVTAWFPCDCQFPVAFAEEGSDPVLAVVRTLCLCLGNASGSHLQPAQHVIFCVGAASSPSVI